MNLSSPGLSLSLILLWNKVRKSALNTGISTQYDDDPDGDAWPPLEADVTLYNHN